MLAAVLGLAAAACGDDDPAAPRATPRPEAAGGAPATPASRPGPARRSVAWTHAELLRRLEGRRVRVRERTVRIDGGTVACGGVGRPARRKQGEPAWTRFRCVQPTFPPGSVAGPDAILIVEPVGPRAVVVTGRRLTSY